MPAPRVFVVQDVATPARPGVAGRRGAHEHPPSPGLCGRGHQRLGARSFRPRKAPGFIYFAGSVSVSHAYVHIVEFGQPVEVGGLRIIGEICSTGICTGCNPIPWSIAAQIPAGGTNPARERELIALCRSPQFALEKLRAAVAQERI